MSAVTTTSASLKTNTSGPTSTDLKLKVSLRGRGEVLGDHVFVLICYLLKI